MKYPWTAASLVIIWLSTTYIILNRPGLDANTILIINFIGTVIISFIGFRVPKIK